MKTASQTKQVVILATVTPEGQYEVEGKILSRSELDKLCKLMPGCQLVIFEDYRKK